MTYTDPDFSTIRSRAAGKGSSARINDTAGQVSASTGKLTGATGGKGPEKFTGDAAEIGKTLSALATDAAISKDVWGDLNKAADAWTANAPKADEMNAAEKAVTDAQAACTAANEKADANPGDADLAKEADDAGEALIKAKQTLIDLQRRRKAANKALLEAIARAIAKAKRITGGRTQHGTGKEMPGAGTDQSTGPGTQSTGSGNPAARTTGSGTPAAKPTGTPSATAPSSTTSTNGSGKGSGLDSSDVATLAALAGQNQNQQGQQAQTQPQQAAPTATQPQPQNQGDKDKKDDPAKALQEEAERNSPAILAAAGIPNATGTPITNASSTPTPAPVANTNGTALRGPDAKITGVGLNGSPAVNTQVPATSGNSQTGLTTQSDVTGRPPGTENKAYSPTPGGAETKTSGANGGNTAQQQAAQQQTGRGMGAGMPMMPAVPMNGPASSGGGGGRSGDGEAKPGVTSTSDPLGLMHERGHAVEGGTIAQNKPNRDKPAA